MAKQSLREFQSQLAERLKSASHEGIVSKLGFVAGARHWLVDLTEINEVVTVAEITPVPWARPWFKGLANVRGLIYGCTDLAAFMGDGPDSGHGEFRLLLTHPRFGVNAAILVARTLGLRNPANMTPLPSQPDDVEWIKCRWRGADGLEWMEIGMEKLVTSPRFLEAGFEQAYRKPGTHESYSMKKLDNSELNNSELRPMF